MELKTRHIPERSYSPAPTYLRHQSCGYATGYQEWTTIKVHIHGFADLSAVLNVPVDSPEFMALGNPWRLKLYPGVMTNAYAGLLPIRLHLCNQSSKQIAMEFGISIDGKDKQVAKKQSVTPTGAKNCLMPLSMEL